MLPASPTNLHLKALQRKAKKALTIEPLQIMTTISCAHNLNNIPVYRFNLLLLPPIR